MERLAARAGLAVIASPAPAKVITATMAAKMRYFMALSSLTIRSA